LLLSERTANGKRRPPHKLPHASDVVEGARHGYNGRMNIPNLVCIVIVVALAGSGCGGTDAFVFKKNEFDRNDANFNKPLADRDEVTICFNGVGTSDRRVALLAEEECGRFGKRAQPEGESFGECPLLVPVAARFLCLPDPVLSPRTSDNPASSADAAK
jgi:hypothetical protein